MKTSTKVIIGGGLVATTGLAIYVYKKKGAKVAHVLDEYIFDNKEDADTVLEKLNESAAKYDAISVADFHDLIGEGASYILHGYGWDSKSISKAKVKKTRKGYTIKFPPVGEIK
jgi:hypothetical protein